MPEAGNDVRPTLALARRMMALFIGRQDVYAERWEQPKRKGYSFACGNKFKPVCRVGKVKPNPCLDCLARQTLPLTEDVFVKHLRGEVTAGLYLINEARVRVACLDIDDHGGDTADTATAPENSPLILGARAVEAGRTLDLSLFLERSGGGRGAHVWIFLRDWVKAITIRRLFDLIKQLASLPHDVEVFPKQRDATDYGSLIALPYHGGPDKWATGRSIFVDPDSGEPLRSDPLAVMDLLDEAAVTEIHVHRILKNRTTVDAPKPVVEVKPGVAVADPVETVFANCAALRTLRDGDGGDKHGYGHNERLALASVIRDLPGGLEALHKLFAAKCSDYVADTTDAHLKSLTHPPMRCSTLQEMKLCTGECETIRKRGGNSPVAFAYEKVTAGEGLTFDNGGFPQCSSSNVAYILLNDERWRGSLAFNTLTCSPFWTRVPPFDGTLAPVPKVGADLQDCDCVYIAGWLERTVFNGPKPLPKTAVIDGFETAAAVSQVHPIRSYLRSLTWDGTARLDSWLTTYLGARARGIMSSVGTWWLISAVARVMVPGCQADHVLVLEGKQGVKKSTALHVLGGDWYSASLGDIRSKDAAENLRGVWIMEIGELDAIRGLNHTRVKDFITKPIDQYRPSYGRRSTKYPRQCVFSGSTNEGAYLADETGGRRFWPVKIGRIDIEALTCDRDQLWAEALTRYDQGARWWPASETENAPLVELQEDRFEADPWEDVIADWLAHRGPATGELTTSNILGYALFLDQNGTPRYERIGRSEDMRCSSIMRRLGYEQVRLRVDGARTRVWMKRESE